MTASEREAANAGHALRDGDIGEVAAEIERAFTNIGHAGVHNNAFDTAAVVIPGGIVAIAHGSGAGDGENAVIGELPSQIIAAGAAGENVGCGGSEGIKVLKQGGEDFLRFGKLGLLIVGQGIVGIVGFLHLVVNLRLLRHGHGLDFLQGGQSLHQGADGLHGFVRLGLSAGLADIGAGLLRGGRYVAAGIVMSMGADQLPGHAPAFYRAGVAAGSPFHGLHIAAALGVGEDTLCIGDAVAAVPLHGGDIAAGVIMGMDAFGHGLIAGFRVFMGAGTSRACRGVATLGGMDGMVRAKALRFLRKRENRDVSKKQHRRHQTAKRSFPGLMVHIASSYVPRV